MISAIVPEAFSTHTCCFGPPSSTQARGQASDQPGTRKAPEAVCSPGSSSPPRNYGEKQASRASSPERLPRRVSSRGPPNPTSSPLRLLARDSRTGRHPKLSLHSLAVGVLLVGGARGLPRVRRSLANSARASIVVVLELPVALFVDHLETPRIVDSATTGRDPRIRLHFVQASA